jgi:hypothetical protein
LKSFYTIVDAAIRRLKDVRILEICYSFTLFRLLSDAHFPRLVECSVPDSVDVIRFISRNPNVCILAMIPRIEGLLGNDQVFKFLERTLSIIMPKLEHFTGPPIAAIAIVPGSLVSNLTIYWEMRQTVVIKFSDSLAAIARSKGDIVSLINITYAWDVDLLSAIAAHLPRLKMLTFHALIDLEGREVR